MYNIDLKEYHLRDMDESEIKINGVKVTRPHFHSFSGCVRQHHAVLTFTEGNYENILIGRNGGHKTIYRITPDKTCEKIGEGDIQPVDDERFIIIDSTLIHIKTKIRYKSHVNSRDISYLGDNIFNLDNLDNTILKWTGTSFKTVKEKSESDINTSKESWAGQEFEKPTDDLRIIEEYDMLVNEIVNMHPYINSKEVAKEYLNGDFESPVPSTDMRNHMRKELEKDDFERIKKIKEGPEKPSGW